MMANVLGSVRAVIFLVIVFLSSFQSVVSLSPFFLPLAIVSPKLFARSLSNVVAFWHVFLCTLTEYILGVKIVITGNWASDTSGPALMVMNHRTRLDWLFFFCLQARLGSLSQFRICLKKELKHIPGPGWVIQLMVFLFVKRRWEEDRILMEKIMEYFNDIHFDPQLLLFPEGTDFTPRTKASSDKFAKNNNLVPFDNVLHPRTKGFSFLCRKMKERSPFHLLDVTVAYPKAMCQSEHELIRGHLSPEIHFNVNSLSGSSIPTDEAELDAFCCDIWRQKEKLLDNYKKEKKFPYPIINFDEGRYRCHQVAATMFWSAFTVLHLVVLISTSFMQIYWACVLATSGLILLVFGGFDNLVMYLQKVHKHFLTLYL